MRVILKLIAILFLFGYSNTSIAQKGFFIPSALIQPTHSEPKQFKVSLGVFRGLDLRTSYSINNRVWVFGKAATNIGTYGRKWMGDDEFKSVRNDNSFSLGVGFFNKTTSDFYFENSIGLSLTKTDNFKRYYSESISFTGKPSSGGYSSVQTNTNYWGAFYQFTGLLIIDDLEIGLASRFVYNRYTNFAYNHSKNLDNGFVGNNFSVYSVEPVGILSYNLNKYKISAQTGLAVGIPDNNSSQTFINLIGRLSLQYSFNSKNK